MVAGAYLPADPEAVIIDIDRESGKPMQSAAKAPFFAKFKVRPCGIEEVVLMNKASNKLLRQTSVEEGASPKDHYKGYIFKVGDDVRQDMLALQLMALFKDIFQRNRLPIHLNPYKVVATGPGVGIA